MSRMAALSQRLGGPAGNATLTSATAAVLTVLLAAEGVTILFLGGLMGAHMFLGLVLLGPVALKLASTGWRFARYYVGATAYRQKGPPVLPLRLLAPLLVTATVGVFASGVALLLLGHRSDVLLLVHKASFIVWGACFAVHFLAHLPRMLRSLSSDWSAAARGTTGGTRTRAALLAGALGAGVLLAVAMLGLIGSWHGGHGG
jgi:hypothetical protein